MNYTAHDSSSRIVRRLEAAESFDLLVWRMSGRAHGSHCIVLDIKLTVSKVYGYPILDREEQSSSVFQSKLK